MHKTGGVREKDADLTRALRHWKLDPSAEKFAKTYIGRPAEGDDITMLESARALWNEVAV